MVQTFLPYPSFDLSAKVLDRQRLGKQRIEAKQIYFALTRNDYGWQSHPAVLMWRGYEGALLRYGIAICGEWVDRGYRDQQLGFFRARFAARRKINEDPPWLGDKAFHASHRSNLLRKDPEWYGQFGWSEGPDLEYVWPVEQATC